MIARAARIVALILLAWQAVVAQAHLHVRPAAATSTVSSVSAAVSTTPQRPDNPVECPVCREVAHAGQYLSPGPILFHPPAPVVQVRAALALPRSRVGRSLHSWRSRAPPALSFA